MGICGQYELLLKLANRIETWQFRILAMFRNPELSVLAAISLRDDFIEMEPLKACWCAEMRGIPTSNLKYKHFRNTDLLLTMALEQ